MEDVHDWSVFDVPGVDDVCLFAASKVARNYELDEDDLFQRARIEMSRKRDLLECLDDDNNLGLGALEYRLECDLINIAEVEVRQRMRTTSYEARMSWGSSGRDGDALGIEREWVSIAVRTDIKLYDRELVESLLPAVWGRVLLLRHESRERPRW